MQYIVKSFKSLLMGWVLFFIAIPVAHSSHYSSPTSYQEHKYKKTWAAGALDDLKHDFSNCFTGNSLLVMGGVFATAGVMANTGIDRSLRNGWQEGIRTKRTDSFFQFPNTLGAIAHIYLPLYFGSLYIGHLTKDRPMGNVVYTWGYRSLRTLIVGGIPAVALGRVLGSGRPINNQDSKWQPFKHHNAVSGHAFFGAIPFITAAQMTEPMPIRAALYVISTLPGLARINLDKHYASQVLLGWSFAFLSAKAVYKSDVEGEEYPVRVALIPRKEGAMLAAMLQF